MALDWQSVGIPLTVNWPSISSPLAFGSQLTFQLQLSDTPLTVNWQSIGIPLVIDLHYIDTQLVSHWILIGIRLASNFNWQQIGIQLAMDWHRLYWIGIPYLPAYTSQKVRPQT